MFLRIIQRYGGREDIDQHQLKAATKLTMASMLNVELTASEQLKQKALAALLDLTSPSALAAGERECQKALQCPKCKWGNHPHASA